MAIRVLVVLALVAGTVGVFLLMPSMREERKTQAQTTVQSNAPEKPKQQAIPQQPKKQDEPPVFTGKKMPPLEKDVFKKKTPLEPDDEYVKYVAKLEKMDFEELVRTIYAEKDEDWKALAIAHLPKHDYSSTELKNFAKLDNRFEVRRAIFEKARELFGSYSRDFLKEYADTDEEAKRILTELGPELQDLPK